MSLRAVGGDPVRDLKLGGAADAAAGAAWTFGRDLLDTTLEIVDGRVRRPRSGLPVASRRRSPARYWVAMSAENVEIVPTRWESLKASRVQGIGGVAGKALALSLIGGAVYGVIKLVDLVTD